MRSTKATRWLSGTLAALMLAQGMCLPVGAEGWTWNSWRGSSSGQTSQVTTLSENETVDVQLQDGNAVIPSGADEAQVKKILFDALVVNKDGIDPQSLDWEYYCTGRDTSTGLVPHDAWGSVNGFTSETGNWIKVEYTHPALAVNKDGDYQVRIAGTETAVTLTKAAKQSSSITLNEGQFTVALPYKDATTVDYDALREAILDEVVASSTPKLTVDDVIIEYLTNPVIIGTITGSIGEKWVPLEGDPGVEYIYYYPAISTGEQKIRISYAGNDTYGSTSVETTVTISERDASQIVLKEGQEVALPYTDANTVDYTALKEDIFDAVVESTTPEMTLDDVKITYYARNYVVDPSVPGASYEWMPLEGGTKTVVGMPLTFPAISEGSQRIQISWNGDATHSKVSAETTVTITERPTANIEVNENPTVQLTVDKDLNLNVDKLYQDMFTAIVKSSEPTLTLDDVEITYYALNYVVDPSVPGTTHEWMPLEGGTKNLLTYPAISAGSQKIRISWPGNQQYARTTIEATVTVNDRDQVQFNKNEGPYEVGMVFNAEQGYDYAATAQAIYNAVVASTTPAVDFANVTLEFSKTGTIFKPLDQTNFFTEFGVGEWKIRISVADTQAYRGNSITVDVKTTDNRIASSVVLKEGASFTYNMDANAMKQAIFDNVIDWDNSTLPSKETLSLDNFVIEYKAKLTDAESGVDLGLEDLKDLIGNIPGMDDILNSAVLTQWVPLEGKVYSVGGTVLGQFPQMGAGENQSIRISYKGNADYRPSGNAEGTVTVNKAKVSVKVNSTNIYADEALPADFITTDPADEFDIYTIYAGITSSVSTGIYLDLPDRYTADGSLLLKLIDQALAAAGQKTLTQMLNEGVTVGELREIFSTQELLDMLDKLNIDTGTFGQILTVINKLPGIMDSVRVGFGTPNRAGLYTVAAVTDSKNYETGVGIGFLLTKMRFSGPKLIWNDEIPNGKLTAEQAQSFNFGATLWYNGEPVENQSSVHYLYSGFTSKWRIYSSTTTPPTEPGRYVVTVCILGGNYMAAPITRSFQITK